MNIALIGYGKMGKMLESLALERGHKVSSIWDPTIGKTLDPKELRKADVAIEFTNPKSALANYQLCFSLGVPVVSGTTGWLSDWEKMLLDLDKYEGTFFYASNFSLGVNLVFKLNKQLSEIMSGFPEYSSHIVEIHHTKKKDAPSGTAITLAQDMLASSKNLTSWSLNEVSAEDVLPIFSIREGNVTGTHTVNYVSDIDKISIRHEAFSRAGFAQGAILAAEFLPGKKGVFNMKDLLADLL